MTQFVDTHCHIQSIGAHSGEKHTIELWAKDKTLTADKVINDALSSGVSKLICVGCNLEDSKVAARFVNKNEHCYLSVGIHPHDSSIHKDNELNELSKLAKTTNPIAIGECGLDYYRLHSPKDDQIRVFKYQIELAISLNLPVIFHIRKAFTDFFEIIKAYSGVRGVVHSFSDNLENLTKVLDLDLYVGVNGIATFSKSDEQKELYKSVPLNKLLLETDAPYLTPQPYRGQLNEPKHVKQIATYLSELRGVSIEKIAMQTTANAKTLFNI